MHVSAKLTGLGPSLVNRKVHTVGWRFARELEELLHCCYSQSGRSWDFKSLLPSPGELTPMEEAELSKVVDSYTRAVETADLAARSERLEQKAQKK
jgi:hypothetical protein